MSSTRKIEGLARTWEEPIGIHKAAFCEGTSKVREGLGYTPATLIIGGKGYTEQEVKAIEEKARKWDELKAAVGKFYPDEPEDDDAVVDCDAGGDLGDIGELCSRKLGYL